MENKDWQDLIVLYEVIKRIKAIEDIPAKDYTEEIQQTLKGLKDVRAELVQQLENQGIEGIKQQDSLKELVSRIEEIEGGGGECLDYSSFFEYVEQFERKASIMKSEGGEGMSGEFPVFPNLSIINFNAFHYSNFTGEFPILRSCTRINSYAFYYSNFTGNFPILKKLRIIGGSAFRDSNFTGEFPMLGNLQDINNEAFQKSNFSGEFPMLNNLQLIGMYAFQASNFTGEFPVMGNLQTIRLKAFASSDFDKDDDGFVVNYPGWDGQSSWSRPSTYRLAIKDQQLPEFKTIYTPGGKMEVLDPEYQQGLIEKHKEEIGEPSNLEYWKEYAAKLKAKGFERDEYGNYVDVVTDKSVIIVPDDIKFQV